MTVIQHARTYRARGGHTHSSKVYTDKQYTCSVWSLQLTHSETSTLWDHGWFSSSMKAPVSQAECIQFLNVLGGRCHPLCYLSATPCNLLLRGRRLNRQLLLTYRHSPPYWWTSAWWICLSVNVIVRWWCPHNIVGRPVSQTCKPQPFFANASRFRAKPSPADLHWLSRRKIYKPSPAERPVSHWHSTKCQA